MQNELNNFLMMPFCSYEIDFSIFSMNDCLFLHSVVFYKGLFMCPFPSLSATRQKTELSYILENFPSEVSNLELLPILESSQAEDEIDNFESICWSLNHGLHYPEYFIPGYGVSWHGPTLPRTDFSEWPGKLGLCRVKMGLQPCINTETLP